MAEPKHIGPFPRGMDNRRPDFKLALGREEGGGHLLRDALNVDVTAQGTVKTRAGYVLAQAGSDCHSLWSPVEGGYALYVDDGNLYRIDSAKTLVAGGFGNVTPVRYAQVYEAVYFTDGLRVGSYHPITGPTPKWASTTATDIGDQVLVPMTAGQHIAHHAGRLLVAVGSAVIYSEPFTPNLRDESKGFELFPAPITCLVAVEGGVFVVADKTYFIAGGFPAQAVRAVLDYGAPDQQPSYRDDGGAHWMSARGVVSCTAVGELSNLQEAHVAMSVEGSAATLMRESDGMRSIVAALTEQGNLGAGVGSYAQARIGKKGT